MDGTEARRAVESYRSRLSDYEELRGEVVFALEKKAAEQGIKTHSVTGRVKTEKSFTEKLERRGFDDPLEQMHDLVGVRVVCLFLSDLPRLRAVIHDLFHVLEEDDQVEVRGAPETFGYMSVHFVCRIGDGFLGPRYDHLKTHRFEVQCRTILMDAWANVSHYLSYKGEASIPQELRRDFHALSGLFYVADKHFEIFFDEQLRTRADAVGSIEGTDVLDVPLNLETMLAYLRAEFPDRERCDPADASRFVEEVAGVGYAKVGQLRTQIRRGVEAAEAYELADPPTSEHDGRPVKYADVGLARTALAMVDAAYRASKYPQGTVVRKFERYAELVRRT